MGLCFQYLNTIACTTIRHGTVTVVALTIPGVVFHLTAFASVATYSNRPTHEPPSPHAAPPCATNRPLHSRIPLSLQAQPPQGEIDTVSKPYTCRLPQ